MQNHQTNPTLGSAANRNPSPMWDSKHLHRTPSTSSLRTNNSSRTSNIELKKLISSDFKKLGRSIVSSSSPLSKRQSSLSHQQPSQIHQISISSLVDPDWDSTTLKNGWINRIHEGGEKRLVRIELKGSNLNIYRLPAELNYVKDLIVHTPAESQVNTMSESILNKEFKNNESSTSLTSSSSNTSDKVQIELSNDSFQDESVELAHLIEDYERGQVELDELQHQQIQHQQQIRLQAQSVPTSQLQRLKVGNSTHIGSQHHSFIIHNLSYESPSCPHPKLTIDPMSGLIVEGNLEAICHTILFHPSESISARLIEVLPLTGSLIDPLVYFQKFLDHFTNAEGLHTKNIKITNMEMNLLFQRTEHLVNYFVTHFKGSLLDDQIFQMLSKLTKDLAGKSPSHTSIFELSGKIKSERMKLLNLISFQLDPTSMSSLHVQPLPIHSSQLISAEQFLLLDLDSLANEIHSIDLHFFKRWSSQNDRSIFLSKNNNHSYKYWKFNPLVFNPSFNTHYLGRLLAFHLFEDPVASKSPSKRAHILMKWIRLGGILCEHGDMIAWLGIALVICSLPVLRLARTWGHVDKADIEMIRKKWAPVVFEIRKHELFTTKSDNECTTENVNNKETNLRIMIPNKVGEVYSKNDAIPHYGELLTYNLETDEDSDYSIKSLCAYMEMVNWNFKQWDCYFDNVADLPDVLPRFVFLESDDSNAIQNIKDAKIHQLLKDAITFNSSNKPCDINSFMEKSVECEPPYAGRFAKFYNISRSPLFLGSYPSILFPQILPHYTIYDRSDLIGALGSLNNNLESKELRYKNRNIFVKHVRDQFDKDSEEFRLTDDSIIFRTCEPVDSTTKDHSRPSSILFENPGLMRSKHVSTLSTGGFSVEDYINSYQAYLKDSIVPDSSDSTLNNFSESDKEKTNLSSGKMVKIWTSAATPERLVDLLVLTASVFGTHLKLEDIENYSKKSGVSAPFLLQMDDYSFTCSFFATYRVFFTTKDLISALYKRFKGSVSASLSIMEGIAANGIPVTIPIWDNVIAEDDETYSKINWKFVMQIQLGVIEATSILVSDYFKHFMDDLETKATFDQFVEMMDTTIITEWPGIIKWIKENKTSDVNEIINIYKNLQSSYKQVRNTCIRFSYTPLSTPIELDFSDELTTIPSEMMLPTSADIDEILKYVNSLDSTIRSVIAEIRVDDWVDTFEVLEMLISRSPLSMFNYKYQDANTHPSLITVSNIYYWIMTLTDDENSVSEKLINQLPATVGSALKLYKRMETYLLMQIIDSDINVDERTDRMRTLLKIIRISRIRMKKVVLFEEDLENKQEKSPDIPSFIESVVTNTILRPESRFFSHAWKLAASLNLQDVDLSALDKILPEFTDYEIKTVEDDSYLSICPGWILGRLVEIASFIPNMGVENTSLINFNKNRFIHNCVLRFKKLQGSAVNKHNKSPYLTESSFLFEFVGQIPSLKTIYEVSVAERREEKLTSGEIFSKHVGEQIQLLKLEETKRNLLIRQRELQHSKDFRNYEVDFNVGQNDERNGSTSDLMTISTKYSNGGNWSIKESTKSISEYDASTHGDTTASTVVNTVPEIRPSQQPTARRNSSTSSRPSSSSRKSHGSSSASGTSSKFKFGFLKSRLTMNISSSNQASNEKKSISLSALPNVNVVANGSKSKPMTVVPLKDASIFPTYSTPNSFTVDLQQTNHEYTFQTSTEQEMSDWIYRLSFAKKHWFFSKNLNKQFGNSYNRLTFGAPLAFVCERDNSNIPLFVDKIMNEIELRGLEEVGIYRKSASLLIVQKIKDEVNKMGDFNMENSLVFDIHNLTGTLKAYLRELPEPLIPDGLVEQLGAVKETKDEFSRFTLYRKVLSQLPTCNFSLIERLSRHMKLVEEYKEQNKMTSYNLATIMGGSLVEGCRPETIRKSFGLINYICEDFIIHYEHIFQ